MKIYLTQETLKLAVEDKCKKHNVNFDYIFGKIMKLDKIPITREDLIETIDNMIADAFWNDYDNMFAGCPYPAHCVSDSRRTKRNDIN